MSMTNLAKGKLSVVSDNLVSAVGPKIHEDRRFTIAKLSLDFPQV